MITSGMHSRRPKKMTCVYFWFGNGQIGLEASSSKQNTSNKVAADSFYLNGAEHNTGGIF